MNDRFVHMAELVEYLGVSRGSIYRLVRAGELARPTKLMLRTPAWRSSQVEEFVERRMRASQRRG